ncbi:hypothetical protein EMIHUDRAFT_453564 [Emiliania huxleyi CCMP1516]|uniref:Lipoprotein n=2 Tax=Emiliania huxleyi TaxID=2903 RepID=A0A0D3I3V9_EMIH1|nr:hypothetical protein EMIHUDRAFT_453564 [Emiliania huxleyi CCMP1516]EOD05944.1 hypothetical protein EMIHUDRAFT_453564 [Emiliania huxleyi CCMP1516]|eukprot:XP_005758373.1 hypothetical protein EMIHUDRAFT_453564 [Emiliania huxleyi CCMP1516]
MRGGIVGAAALLLLGCSAYQPGAPHGPPLRHQRSRASTLCADGSAPGADGGEGAAPKDSAAAEEDSLARDLAEEIGTREFTSELYAHLQRRPDYETSELYKALRNRIDVVDPIYSNLEEAKGREAAVPTPGQTPGEIIDLVLIALREDRADRSNPAAGVETLMRFSGPGSSIHMGSSVTAPMLLGYFQDSKYAVLLDWVSVSYPKKLELSIDKKKALQQCLLRGRSGEAVPVTFQFTKHETVDGQIWLIDQVLVKGVSAD